MSKFHLQITERLLMGKLTVKIILSYIVTEIVTIKIKREDTNIRTKTSAPSLSLLLLLQVHQNIKRQLLSVFVISSQHDNVISN